MSDTDTDGTTIRSNVTNELLASAFEDVRKCMRAEELPKAQTKATVKKYKALGVDIAALKSALKFTVKDEQDGMETTRQFVRCMVMAGFPYQPAELFADLDVGNLDDQRGEAFKEFQAWDVGYLNGKEGADTSLNPFEAGSSLWERWDRGWRDGARIRAIGAKANGVDEVAEPRRERRTNRKKSGLFEDDGAAKPTRRGRPPGALNKKPRKAKAA